MRGDLFIVSAPSGTGKTTLIRNLMENGPERVEDLVFSVSHTTRPARRGEVEGRDYHFIDRASFERMIAEDRFLEWEVVYGQYKGTARDEVYPRLERGVDVLLDIDVQGAEQVMRRHPEACSIFILPPSYADLERRLVGRGLDDPADISRRLGLSLSEIERYERYRYVIINDDLERASRSLAAIVLEKQHRIERVSPQVKTLLAEFSASHAAGDPHRSSEKERKNG